MKSLIKQRSLCEAERAQRNGRDTNTPPFLHLPRGKAPHFCFRAQFGLTPLIRKTEYYYNKAAERWQRWREREIPRDAGWISEAPEGRHPRRASGMLQPAQSEAGTHK